MSRITPTQLRVPSRSGPSGRVNLALLLALAGALFLAVPAQATFPGANGAIAFQSDRDGSYDIFVGPSADTAVNITNTRKADEFAPSFDPSGDRIVFESNRTGKFKLYIAKADGSKVRQLTRGQGDDRFGTFCDERTVVFQRGTGGNTEIYRVNTSGKKLKQLTERVGTDSQPACRPDGNRIAFISDRSRNLDIWEMNLRGKNLRNLTRHAAAEVDPDYSPDGKQLTFVSTRAGNEDVYLMKRVGKRGSVVRLTTAGAGNRNRLPKFTPAFGSGDGPRAPQGVGGPELDDPFGNDSIVFTGLPHNGPEQLGRVTYPGLHSSPIIEIADDPPANSAPAIQPRVRIRVVGSKLLVNGTDGDDHIEIREEPGRIVVFVNRIEKFAYDKGPAFTDITCIRVWGHGGNDTLKARDTLEDGVKPLGVEFYGGDDDDKLLGGRGDDLLRGGTGRDFAAGGDGDDRVDGQGGRDILDGQDGDDKVNGGPGPDVVDGGAGDDTVTGGIGDDALRGGEGNDTMRGGKGNDTASGGPGTDRASGAETTRGVENLE